MLYLDRSIPVNVNADNVLYDINMGKNILRTSYIMCAFWDSQ